MRRLGLLVVLPAVVMAGGCIFGDYLVSDYTEGGGGGGVDAVSASSTGTGGGSMDGGVVTCTGDECTWSHRYGDEQEQTVGAVALGTDSSVYFTGTFDGNVELGGGVPGLNDKNVVGGQPYLAKLDTRGNPQWIRGITVPGEPAAVTGEGVEVVPVIDGVLWTGYVSTANQQRQAFLRKEDANGTAEWDKQIGSTLDDEGRAIAVAGDMVYLAGTVQGTGSDQCLDNYTIPPTYKALFIAAYDASGACKWGDVYNGGSQIPESIDMAITKDGHLLVTGHTSVGKNPGGSSLVGTAGEMFLLDLAADNGLLLATQSFTNAVPSSIAVDTTTGNVFMTGSLKGTMMSTPGPGNVSLTGDMEGDWFVLARGPGPMFGDFWGKTFPGTGPQTGMKIVADPGGRLLVWGTSVNTMDTGDASPACEDGKKCMVLMQLFSDSGTAYSSPNARSFGATTPGLEKTPLSMAYNDQALVLGASWDGYVDFTGKLLSPAGSNDILVAKFTTTPIP